MNPDMGIDEGSVEEVPSDSFGGVTRGEPFPATRWSLIEECQNPSSTEFRTGMEVLCQKYWPPAYWFIRRYWNCGSEEAKDLCQAFFLKFYEKDFVQGADIHKGRFRTFVCVALKRFLSKTYRDMSRLKRKPAEGPILSMDALVDEEAMPEIADSRLSMEDFEESFQAEWKKQVVHNVLSRMRKSAQEKGEPVHAEIFARYRVEYDKESRPTREQLAEEFGLTLHQVRRVLRDEEKVFVRLMQEELLDQVSSPADLEDEFRILFGV